MTTTPASMRTMTERERIASWLTLRVAEELGPILQWPDWRIWLYAVVHPRRSARLVARLGALTEAADAIERGDHLEPTK